MSKVFVKIKMCYVHNQWYDISCATLYDISCATLYYTKGYISCLIFSVF